jgi:NAD(P)-dependent dehydrogenase (short-subunit alcohol dehydrogenase family)
MTQTILITGCSSGMGLAAVAACRRAGWNVVATMRDPEHWKGDSDDAGLMICALDVTDAGSIDAAFSMAIQRFGRLDCVVNNAGRGLLSVFEATPAEIIAAVFATNVFGPMSVMRAAIKHMRETGGGRIINVTSGSAIVPEPLMSIYSASKAALDTFTESVSFELAPQAIELKLIVPGFVPGTSFVQQTQAAAHTVPVPPVYTSYVNQRMASYSGTGPMTFATDEDVANAILAAAVDLSGQLRWLVGPDVAEFGHMRWETSEAQYAAWTHSRFAPEPITPQ